MSTKNDKFTTIDKYFMRLAINLARNNVGLTGDNPSVGCVIVKNNKLISSGQTSFNGRPHAEFNAINNSKSNLNGTTMYVTLEPCNHYGKTPPCTNLIIKKKIKKIIYSINDIDKRTMNKTSKILKSKKILVKTGLFRKKITDFYNNYFLNRKKRIPYVTGKIAMSKNNIIYSKKNKKITNMYSDKISHLLRYRNDSILISYKTLNKDNPKLNCRINGLENFSPNKIILDKNLKSKLNSNIFNNTKKKNYIIYNNASKRKISLFTKKGVKLIKLNLNNKKKFNLNELLNKLFFIGCRNLLVEGGKNLTNDFLKNKAFNQFYLFKTNKNIPKNDKYIQFKPFKDLSRNFNYKTKINSFLVNDIIYLYKNKNV